jgi:hypothetical protein
MCKNEMRGQVWPIEPAEDIMSPRIFFAWLALIVPPLAAASDTNYIVAPISGKYTAVVDLNDVGQVGINKYENGRMTDLNELIADEAGVLLVSASAINERHQILAFACDPTAVFCYTSVRLDPIPAIPEPGGTAMLLAGALLLMFRGSGARVLAVFARGACHQCTRRPGRLRDPQL